MTDTGVRSSWAAFAMKRRICAKDCATGALDLRELLGPLLAVGTAVGYARSRQVIHLDLKEQNIVLGPYGEVMLLDWGLAKIVGEAETPNSKEQPESAPPLSRQPGDSRDLTIQGIVLNQVERWIPRWLERLL